VALSAKPGQFVSLTGGEPLLWTDFCAELIPKLRTKGLKTYLETNGTMVKEMARLDGLADVVAMDIKPPSSCGQDLWRAHREFLTLIKDRAFVKIVITSTIQPAEVERAVELVAEVGPAIPLVLQPAAGDLAPDMGLARKYLARASERLSDVRMVSQMHKVWQVR
jgi:organic radical activating enzyme